MIAKSAILRLFIFIVVSQFLSCGKGPKCWGSDKNKGIIIADVAINCPPLEHHKNYIIDSDSAYRMLFDVSCALPEINFEKESLLGIFSVNSGCESKITREVIVHKTEPRYIYKVVIKRCGLCFSGMLNMNWVRVSKVPKDWTVTFTLDEK